VKRPRPPGHGHVEAGQVATRRAAITGARHGFTLSAPACEPTDILSLQRPFDSSNTCSSTMTAMVLPIDDPDAPLSTVTFVVVDLETTGGSPWACGITEVGAVKLRGGKCVGTFQTLVNPGVTIPPEVTYMTGITTSMVQPAPLIDAVLPSLLEFIGGAVIVGHNVRFDLSFLGAAADRLGYPRPTNRVIDTCTLARRLVADEIEDCKLSTLSAFFRTGRRPTHRALDDAAATGEVLHGLLERAGSFGVVALDDLLEFPAIRGRAQLAKFKITKHLPRRPGVYVFRDACGRALLVGAAADLRRHVRAFFAEGVDDRRRSRILVREVASIDHTVYGNELEAGVQAIRLNHRLSPRFGAPTRPAYVRLLAPSGRVSVVRQVRPGDVYLGPLPSVAGARLVAAAIPSQGGAIEGLTMRPDRLLDPLARKMAGLAAAHRYEEAAAVRDQWTALAGALHHRRRFDALLKAGTVVVEVPGEGGAVLDEGRLVAAWGPGDCRPGCRDATSPPASGAPLSPSWADELAVVADWIEARWDRLDLLDGGTGFDWPAPYLSPFDPRPASWGGGDRSGVAGRWRDAVA
jgi:DNA polymerase-3 subunit epsilon